jgi:SAM-dependent methyltransferase
MRMDVVDLRDFYETALGQVARRVLRQHIREIWPDARGLAVLGLGFATPFLGPFRAEAARVVAAMPASQGVLHWPAEGNGLTALTEEVELPFPDLSIDRVLMVHALETADQVRPLMREIWRVLSGSGRLLAVVPNRTGIWARLERTPFGYGRPYSPAQLSRLLRDSMFTPIQSRAALFVPPTRSRMVLASAAAWERLGRLGLGTFAGVVMAEAGKQIYAAQPLPHARRRAAYAPAPSGAAKGRVSV